MITYERNFDENRHFSFLIKKEKVFIKYMEILEKVRSTIKNKFNRERVYSKKYRKTEKKTHTHTKGGFQCLYALMILIPFIQKMKTIILKCF